MNTPRLPRWASTLALVLLVFASYTPAILEAGWIWDDDEYVTRNPVLRPEAEDGLLRIWTDRTATPQYYPVVYTSFWIETRLFPSEKVVEQATNFEMTEPYPTGFHVTNVLLMAGIVLLFHRVLVRLAVPGAWFAAALFAVHPVHVESVAWVTERKNLLSALFMLTTALCYLRFAGIPERSDRSRWGSYAAGLAFWILGLLSKSVIAFAPPALFLLVWWKRPDAWRRHVVPLLPFLALGVAAGLHTAWLESDQVIQGVDYFGLSALDRITLAGSVVWLYLLHVVAPLEQIFFYPKWDPDPGSLGQWALVLAAVALVAGLMATTRRLGRGPLVAILIFGGGLVPVMGFFDVYPFRFSWVADHFQFHANLALFALLGVLAARVPVAGPARIVIGTVLVLGLAFLSGRQCLAYRDAEALWTDTIAKNPDCWIAHQNLGELLRDRGELDRAVASFERGLAIEKDPRLFASLAAAQLDRFDRDRDPKHLDAAITFGEQALAAESEFAQARIILARAFGLKGGHRAQVVEHLEALLATVAREKMQAAFVERKLTSPQMTDAARQLYRLYSELGVEALAAGDAREAFGYFHRSARVESGTNGKAPRDLYPWTPDSPWLQLELQRIWLLAAAGADDVRDPARALQEVEALMQAYGRKMAEGRVPRGVAMSRSIEILDLKAAAQAGAGQSDAALATLNQALATVAGAEGAPAAWVRGMRERQALYAAGRVFRVQRRVPLAMGQ